MSGPGRSGGDEAQDLRGSAALYDLAAAYARNVDRRNYDAVVALFVPGGRLVSPRGSYRAGDPPVDGSADDTLSGLLRANLSRYEVTTHFLGQQTAEITGDEATAETYCMAHHIYEVEGQRYDRVMSIRYQDSCRRIEGEWRFEERCLVVDWTDVRLLA